MADEGQGGPQAGGDAECDCCIAGGGPAGMMLAVLLARAGLHVIVLEKHGDFLRDFRGDTIHPSTLQVMHELGVLEEFLQRPHTRVSRLRGFVAGSPVTLADFSHLPVQCKFIAMMPQWDFLDFLLKIGSRYKGFELRRDTEVVSLLRDGAHGGGPRADGSHGDRVTGVIAKTPAGELRVRSSLVVGADGRTSRVRAESGLAVQDIGASIDVLWMRIPKVATDPGDALGYIDRGRMAVLLDRGDYWQCAYVIPKGGLAELQSRGINAFRDGLTALTPFLADRVQMLDWADIKLLTVKVDRVTKWYVDGLLIIGDAAHAMSPVGGIGINLAIQDAVAAANILAGPLAEGVPDVDDLHAVQERREWPTKITQFVQVTVQNRIISAVLQQGPGTRSRQGLALRAFQLLPFLQRFPARAVGMGFRPEHVHTDVA